MSDKNKLIGSWLNLQCGTLAGAKRGVVLRANENGGLRAAAHWPATSIPSPALTNIAAAASSKTACTVDPFDPADAASGREGDVITCPLQHDDRPFGIVAIEVPAGSDAQRRACAKALQWGAAWLDLLLSAREGMAENHLLTVIDMVATALEQPTFHESATAVVTELARRVGCERVSLGFLRRQASRVLAVSRSASADNRTALLRAIGGAMDEAVDQDTTLVFPPADATDIRVVDAHAQLSDAYCSGSICTVPITVEGRLVGAMTFEHREVGQFDATNIALYEAIVALVGPILAGKRKEEQWAGPRLLDSLRGQLAKLTGPRHARFKFVTAMVILAVAFLGFATGEYRVSADATLESMVQRAVTAPFDGYVDDSSVRPGDLVKADEVLCRLEDRDLKLEQLKWSSEAAKLQKEYREAMAAHENSRVRILQAQLEQASAQLELVEEQLARTQVTAPVDGMIVKGDLTQSLGAPVERGDILFEVAPLNDYRVMLAVDEREIGRLQTGLAGQLALAGLPDARMPIVVQRITPISTVEDGRNFFAVQAKLLSEQTRVLRPGMQGVGKIYIGRRKLVWIWTHEMLDW
ncbi:MAG: HlyD family efflux transporter periplasmic adaptor subunit, partial [Gammaproteobacteria bacterium]|nr:HlyD family efflux transporter periplasmic adaptor subunit [Gammaproteobacteria bacterium]